MQFRINFNVVLPLSRRHFSHFIHFFFCFSVIIVGVILHTIRITTIVEVLPRVVALVANDNDSITQWTWTVPVVLLSWAVTEVGRYPMYLAPSNDTCRKMRMILPLLTFPIGAFAEFCCAYQVFFGNSTNNNKNNDVDPVPLWLQFLLVLMMLANGVLGPYLAYPHLLKKGLPVLGLSLSSASNKKPKLRSV
jgi:Protein tyrosine phosphatase-like protein, PTPLA